jgi:hypothetical protein
MQNQKQKYTFIHMQLNSNLANGRTGDIWKTGNLPEQNAHRFLKLQLHYKTEGYTHLYSDITWSLCKIGKELSLIY